MNDFLNEIEEKFINELSPKNQEYFNYLKENGEKFIKNGSTVELTENGSKILQCMQDNQEKYINIYKAKDIGEILFMTPRSVSGSMKKLITQGYVEKIGSNPVAYGLTDLGKSYQFDKE